MEEALRDMVSHSIASMIETTVHPVKRSLPKWSLSWCKIFTAFIATRQKQADIRVAMYLRDLPADLVRRLDVLPDVATATLRPQDEGSPDKALFVI
jgi:hypothetical protein